MSVTISNEPNNCAVVTIDGILTYKDLEQAQNSAKGMLKPDSKINCLILAKTFGGWAKEGDWGDLTFLYQSDPFVGKIAVVADKKWKDELLMFLGAGRRLAAVQYFSSDHENKARQWLLETAR